MFPILVIIAGAALWLLTRKEAEVPILPMPEPPPAPAPEVIPVPLYAVGDLLSGRDGHTAAVVATRWDPIAKFWYYQLGSWTNWYREDELLTKPRPALSEWPENTTGQVMVRALDPQGQKVLITEVMAQRIAQDNTSGWLLFGVVEPTLPPVEVDRQVVELLRLLEIRELANSDCWWLDRFGFTQAHAAEVYARAGSTWTIVDVVQWLENARRLGWSPGSQSFTSWANQALNWQTLFETGAYKRAHGLMPGDGINAIWRQQGEAGTEALKQMVVIANTLNTDLSGAERLAREYRTSIGGAPPCDLTITPISTKPRLTTREAKWRQD